VSTRASVGDLDRRPPAHRFTRSPWRDAAGASRVPGVDRAQRPCHVRRGERGPPRPRTEPLPQITSPGRRSRAARGSPRRVGGPEPKARSSIGPAVARGLRRPLRRSDIPAPSDWPSGVSAANPSRVGSTSRTTSSRARSIPRAAPGRPSRSRRRGERRGAVGGPLLLGGRLGRSGSARAGERRGDGAPVPGDAVGEPSAHGTSAHRGPHAGVLGGVVVEEVGDEEVAAEVVEVDPLPHPEPAGDGPPPRVIVCRRCDSLVSWRGHRRPPLRWVMWVTMSPSKPRATPRDASSKLRARDLGLPPGGTPGR